MKTRQQRRNTRIHTLYPDEYITDDNPVRFLDAFVKAKAKVSAADPVK